MSFKTKCEQERGRQTREDGGGREAHNDSKTHRAHIPIIAIAVERKGRLRETMGMTFNSVLRLATGLPFRDT